MVFTDLRGCIDLCFSNQTQTLDDPWETGDLDLQVINPQVFPQVFLWVLMDHRDSCWSLDSEGHFERYNGRKVWWVCIL
jgi:hypothetical protein